MKVNLKKIGIEAEGDIEGVAKKILDNHEKDWKEKFNTKHNAKKEIMELKHKHKLEEEKVKNERKEEKNKIEKLGKQSKSKIKIVSIVLFFIYGIFCIVGFQDEHIIPAIISLIQMIFVLMSIFTSMELFKLFRNDYKLFFVLSILLIIPWLAFAV